MVGGDICVNASSNTVSKAIYPGLTMELNGAVPASPSYGTLSTLSNLLVQLSHARVRSGDS
jgi:hypothetical protein